MTDREKLIELLETVVSPNEVLCDGEVLVSTARVADHLIANGVTVQQWSPASDPPKDTHEYWIAYMAGCDYYYSTGYFDGKCWCSALTHHKIPVTHWMPLPQPPKGE